MINRRRLPETRKCRRPSCRAWSWELAAGKPCPYCRRVDLVARLRVWFDRTVVWVALTALASLAYMAYLSRL